MWEKLDEKEALLRMRSLQEKFDLNPKLLKYLEDGKRYYSYRVSRWSFDIRWRGIAPPGIGNET